MECGRDFSMWVDDSRRWWLRRLLTGGAGIALAAGSFSRCLLRAQIADDYENSMDAADDPANPVVGAALVPHEAVAAGFAFLAGRQNADGTFGEGFYRENPAVNSLAGMAFLASGAVPGRDGEYRQVMDRTLRWVTRQIGTRQLAEAGDESRGPMYSLGFATHFLAECYGMGDSDQLGPVLREAVGWILAAQNAEGGWRYGLQPEDADISVTACQMMALRAARNVGVAVPKTAIDRAVRYIRGCQNPDGGFMYMSSRGGPSAFARSAAAMASFYVAGVYDDPSMDRGVEYLEQFRPSRAGENGKPAEKVEHYYWYGHYYAAMAMWQRGGVAWWRWYPAVRDEIVAQQQRPKPDGPGRWDDKAISTEFATACALITLLTPLERLPLFQR